MIPNKSFLSTLNLILISFVVVTCVEEVYRLPNNVRPARYILTMEPNLEPDLSHTAFKGPALVPYNGSVVIELKVLETTRNITLHYGGTQIDNSSIQVASSSGDYIKVYETSEDNDNEIYTIHLDSDLIQGQNYTLTIGNFKKSLELFKHSIYSLKHKNEEGVERKTIITDFKPARARHTFPCFDEPGIKAKFVINLIRKAEHNSVSNQELESTTDLGDGRYQDTFKETPDMSTYLVAFVISDLKSTKQLEKHRILGRSDYTEKGSFDYALQISVKILKELEDYTGIKFSMDKMEQVALPAYYFSIEPIGGYGLVIHEKQHIACTNASAAKDFKDCTTHISQAFARQWFENLVTPAWWDYIWLSESLADYFQYYIANIVQPSWRLMDLFVIDRLHTAFHPKDSYQADSLNFKIQWLGQAVRGGKLYAKGSSILRMMEHALTTDVFKKGIQIYLRDRQFNSAVPSDLYNALQKSVDEAQVHDLLGNLAVTDIMRSWDSNSKFPIVTVTRDYNTGSLSFEQAVFVPTTNKYYKDVDDKNMLWTIPVNYIFQSDNQEKFSNTTADFWLKEKNITLTEDFPTDGWLIVNKQQTGFYRVNYDNENWERIISFMNGEHFKSIHVINRAQLIDDAFNLAALDYISYDIPLRLCDYMVHERDYIPFAAFYERIILISERNAWQKTKPYFDNYTLKNDIDATKSINEALKHYVITKLTGILNYLGFDEKENDTFLDKFNRAALIYYLCYFNHAGCLKYAEDKFAQFKQTRTIDVHPNIVKNVFCTVMQKATEEDFDALYQIYDVSTDIHQRRRLWHALSCSEFSYKRIYK